MVFQTPPSDDFSKNYLINHALRVLEFDAIRHALLQHVQFFNARKIIANTLPISDETVLLGLHQETLQARDFIREAGDIDLSFPEDLNSIIERTNLGGILTCFELLSVAEFIDLVGRTKTKLFNHRSYAPLLNSMVSILPELANVSNEIRMKVTSSGELSEESLPSIKRLRGNVRSSLRKLNAEIQKSLLKYDKSLSDSVISIRSERLVLPVRSDRRRDVSGIVHDVSDSGATVFIEPFEVVNLANSWREDVERERREGIRIIRQISNIVGELGSEFHLIISATATLDSIFARARYSIQIGGTAIFQPSAKSLNPRIFLKGARHPLLGENVVPIDVDFDSHDSVLVISGPNTGGKTVAMKTIGLLALMNQSGILIPVMNGSELPVFDHVFADIGDGQSIEQSVSTFSSHIKNIASILKFATHRSLVLLDELGSSTDPDEGAALAKAISSNLASKGVFCVVTTHFRSMAAFADSRNGMVNAGVELDKDTMLPTYKLLQKSWGRSFGIVLASKLGIPESLIKNSKNLLATWFSKSERVLDQLEKDKDKLKNLYIQVDENLRQLKVTRNQLSEELDYLLSHRDDMLENLKSTLGLRRDNLLKKLRRIEKSMDCNGFQHFSANGPETKLEIDGIKEELKSDCWIPSNNFTEKGTEVFNIGEHVRIKGMEVDAIIETLPGDSEEEIFVTVGSVRLSISKDKIEKMSAPSHDDSSRMMLINFKDDASNELDLRGNHVDDAIIKLQDFLDDSSYKGATHLRVIHGYGTGVLRRTVREYLDTYPLVKNFGPEKERFGGNGATFVEI